MKTVYQAAAGRGSTLDGTEFERLIDLEKNKPTESNRPATLVEVFNKHTEDRKEQGMIALRRYHHYKVVSRILERFLTIRHLENITPQEFTAENLCDLRLFIINEVDFVDSNPELYRQVAEDGFDIPTATRGQNTTVTKLKILKAFFADLEDEDIIVKSPFRRLGKTRREEFLSEEYDSPVCLTIDELLTIINTKVPERLQSTKDAFIVQCAFGCRIGDFSSMTLDNVAVKDGIPFVHYLAEKTLRKNKSKKEIETPIVRYAFDIIKANGFTFPILKNASGKSGYNVKIKELVSYCGITRLVKVFDQESKRNIDRPLVEFASSKLCRKTHVDIMNKVQIDKYAAGLHERGSNAVDRYHYEDIKDKFALMNLAFQQPTFKVDNELNIID